LTGGMLRVFFFFCVCVCGNENFVIAETKLKDHHAAKFMDMGFQLYGAIHLLIWLSICMYMGLFTDMFIYLSIRLSIGLPNYPLVWLFLNLLFFFGRLFLNVCLFTYLFVYVYVSIYLFVYFMFKPKASASRHNMPKPIKPRQIMQKHQATIATTEKKEKH